MSGFELSNVDARAEEELIGSVLRKPDLYWQVKVEPVYFSSPFNRKAWSTIAALMSQQQAVDVVTVADAMGDDSALSSLGTMQLNSVGANAEMYARIIRETHQKRALWSALEQGLDMLRGDDDVAAVTEHVSSALSYDHEDDGTCWVEAITQSYESAKEAKEHGYGSVAHNAISMSIPKLDWVTRGMRPGQLIILGGRPGTLKSGLAMQMLTKNAQADIPCGIISGEMVARELADRAIASHCGVDGQRYAFGDPEAFDKVDKSLDGITRWPIFIDDKSHTLRDVRARIVEWVRRHGVRFVVIDYLGLISAPARERREQLGQITRELKQLAQRFGIPILLLSQLNRKCEAEKRAPVLSDLRDSGDIEQDADVVLFTYRDDRDQYAVIVAKQRAGPPNKWIDLKVDGATYTIKEAGDIITAKKEAKDDWPF